MPTPRETNFLPRARLGMRCSLSGRESVAGCASPLFDASSGSGFLADGDDVDGIRNPIARLVARAADSIGAERRLRFVISLAIVAGVAICLYAVAAGASLATPGESETDRGAN